MNNYIFVFQSYAYVQSPAAGLFDVTPTRSLLLQCKGLFISQTKLLLNEIASTERKYYCILALKVTKYGQSCVLVNFWGEKEAMGTLEYNACAEHLMALRFSLV